MTEHEKVESETATRYSEAVDINSTNNETVNIRENIDFHFDNSFEMEGMSIVQYTTIH